MLPKGGMFKYQLDEEMSETVKEISGKHKIGG